MHEDEDLPLLLLSDKTIEVLIALSDAESTCTMRRRKLLFVITITRCYYLNHHTLSV
jgi:hypothetical protein